MNFIVLVSLAIWAVLRSPKKPPQITVMAPEQKFPDPLPVVVKEQPESWWRKFVSYFVEPVTFIAVLYTILLTHCSLTQTEQALAESRTANKIASASLDVARKQTSAAVHPKLEIELEQEPQPGIERKAVHLTKDKPGFTCRIFNNSPFVVDDARISVTGYRAESPPAGYSDRFVLDLDDDTVVPFEFNWKKPAEMAPEKEKSLRITVQYKDALGDYYHKTWLVKENKQILDRFERSLPNGPTLNPPMKPEE